MDIINLIISLVSGAIGGNAAGAAMKDNNDLGVAANSVIGLLGGGAGQYVFTAIGLLSTAPATEGFDISSLLANIGTSGVSGAVLLAAVSYIKGMINKKSV